MGSITIKVNDRIYKALDEAVRFPNAWEGMVQEKVFKGVFRGVRGEIVSPIQWKVIK